MNTAAATSVQGKHVQAHLRWNERLMLILIISEIKNCRREIESGFVVTESFGPTITRAVAAGATYS